VTSLPFIQRELDELLRPGNERGFFPRLWGITQEPAEVRAEALAALMQEMTPKGDGGSVRGGPRLKPLFDAACRELQANVTAVRELKATREHPPFAYVTWLWRVSQTLAGIEQDGWLETPAAPPAMPAPPVAARAPERLPRPAEPPLPPLQTGPRLRGLAFAPLLDAARRETDQLGRRRRLFEAARRLLLETSASTPQTPGLVQSHLLAIAQEIRQINAWQAAGLDPSADVRHQLHGAIKRRDGSQALLLLGAFTELARSAPRTAPFANDRRRLQQAAQRCERFGKPQSVEQVRAGIFGETAARAVERGAARALSEKVAQPGAELELLRAASSVDGAFELGRTVSPVRVLEEQRRMAEVPFPTQNLVLAPARRVSDLSSSLIGDPRLLLYDFASHALLSRRYLAQRKQRRSTSARYSEARYYLLDGSASMAGRRARMRDAILVAELSTMIRHLEEGSATARPVVYYRYFCKVPEPLTKAASIAEACAAIEAVLVRKSRGETDIEGALLQCFRELSQVQAADDTMRRAQLVLVTDGVARIDLQRVWAARQALGEMPVSVSVIALGTESPALQELAAWQRARGEAVFYHYLSDETLYRMARGARIEPAKTAPTPPAPTFETVDRVATAVEPEEDAASDAELWAELDSLLAELDLLQEPVDLDAIERAEHLDAAYEDLGMSLSDVGLEGERARCEARRRDARALAARFEGWFPESLPRDDGASDLLAPAELREVIEVALLSVVDLVAYLDGSPLQRQVDAIELLERLLVEAGVSPWAYVRALPYASAAARSAISTLRGMALVPDAAQVRA